MNNKGFVNDNGQTVLDNNLGFLWQFQLDLDNAQTTPAVTKMRSGRYKCLRSLRCCNKHMCNIFLLGFGFLFCFGAFFTCIASQTVVLNSVRDEYFQGTSTMGYVCLALNFSAMTLSFILSPALSALIGPKMSMVTGAGFLTVAIAVFYRPLNITLYLGAISSGIGSGIVWTVYGHFLTSNSTDKNIGRNTGIFWMLFQTGPVAGNLFYFLLTNGASTITEQTRHTLFLVLLPASACGILTLAMLRHPWTHDYSSQDLQCSEKQPSRTTRFKDALVSEFRMAKSKDMLLFIPMFFYMGIELTFYMNVFATSLGYTLQFGSVRESLVGLNGVFVGIGQVIGGIFYGAMGDCFRRKGRDIGIMIALLVHMVAFFIVFLILPANSSLGMTDSPSFVPPNPYLAMLCSILFGFGDAGWNNPLFALFGKLYPNDPVSAFAIFQAYQSFGNVCAFAYSTMIDIPAQLIIMVFVGVIGAAGFCVIEWRVASEDMIVERKKNELKELENK